MKKFVISVIISVFIVFIVDIIFYTIDIYNINKHFKKYNFPQIEWRYSIIANTQSKESVLNSDFREPINLKSKNLPIIIFGCSFAFGENLNDNETFGANLAKLTNRPVYNYGISGSSIQHFLALLENKDFSNIKNPEYIIYVYMVDHMRRMYSKFYDSYNPQCYFRYIYKNNELKIDDKNDISLYSFRKLRCFLFELMTKDIKNRNKNMLIFSKYIEKANSIIKEKFPNAKFIVYVYEDTMNYDWKTIENMGIKVVKNIDDKRVWSMKTYDAHPSAEAWKYYTPIFIKEAGIK